MQQFAPLHIRQALKKLGFSENESKIVSLLFVSGELTSKQISKLVAIPYDSVHYLLSILRKKGLVTQRMEGNNEYASLCDKDDFLQWIDQQKEKNMNVYTEAKFSLSKHFESMDDNFTNPTVTYFEGKDGVKEIYEEIIDSGDDIYCWTDLDKIYELLGDYTDEFVQKRVEANIVTNVIKPKGNIGADSSLDKERLRNVKFVDDLSLDGEIRIFGNKVAVITLDQLKPVGFLFSSKVISDMFKSLFDYTWKTEANKQQSS